MKTRLILKFEFIASHALAGFETPHPHFWRLEAAITGTPIAGKIVDMMQLREAWLPVVDSIRETYLNDSLRLDEESRKFPTCETLSRFFWTEFEKIVETRFQKDNPTLQIETVAVAIFNAEGTAEHGAAQLSR